MGFDWDSHTFADGRESLSAGSMDVCDVVITAQFIIQDDVRYLKLKHKDICMQANLPLFQLNPSDIVRQYQNQQQ